MIRVPIWHCLIHANVEKTERLILNWLLKRHKPGIFVEIKMADGQLMRSSFLLFNLYILLLVLLTHSYVAL